MHDQLAERVFISRINDQVARRAIREYFHKKCPELAFCQMLPVTTLAKVRIGFPVPGMLSHGIPLLVSFSLLAFPIRWWIGITVVFVGTGGDW